MRAVKTDVQTSSYGTDVPSPFILLSLFSPVCLLSFAVHLRCRLHTGGRIECRTMCMPTVCFQRRCCGRFASSETLNNAARLHVASLTGGRWASRVRPRPGTSAAPREPSAARELHHEDNARSSRIVSRDLD
jgi:hypothetical protein